MIYGVGRLQQRTTCVFYQFQIFDNIAEKGGAGGLNEYMVTVANKYSNEVIVLQRLFTAWRE